MSGSGQRAGPSSRCEASSALPAEPREGKLQRRGSAHPKSRTQPPCSARRLCQHAHASAGHAAPGRAPTRRLRLRLRLRRSDAEGR